MGDHLEKMLDIMDSDNNSHSKQSTIAKQIPGIRGRLSTLDKDVKSRDSDQLPITGKDIKDTLKLKPGPIYKEILAAVQDAVDENPNLSKKQALDIAKGIASK